MMVQSEKITEKTPKDYRHTFTVFTATYNRAHTLHRVYESLKKQSFKDFEWLVVDDGSQDDTYNLINQWQAESLLNIRYFYQKNQGKHIAFNWAVQEANGELFLNLDSDDSCKPEALKRFKLHWDSIPEILQHQFSGVACLCQDENGKTVGNPFPFNPTDSDALELQYRYKVTGDKWGFHRTEVLKKYPFPEIPGYPCIPPGIVWKKIARKYKTRFVNETLRTYYSGNDQITKNIPGKNSFVKVMQYQTILNFELDYFHYSPLKFYLSSIHYSRFSFHQKNSFNQQFKKIQSKLGLFLWIISLFPGYLAYLRDLTKSTS